MVKSHPDYILFGVVILLIILGILILSSVSFSISQEKFGTSFYYLSHQLLYGFLPGIILSFLAFKIELNSLKKWAPLLLLINLILLSMVFLPKIGVSFRGASRWLNFGKITFQPSEFLKLTFILYLASWINSRTAEKFKKSKEFSKSRTLLAKGILLNRNKLRDILKVRDKNLLAFSLIIIVISLLLIFQPDISTLGVIILVAILMYFLANTPLWQSILIILIGGGGFLGLIKIAPYRFSRLMVFLNPELDPLGIGYQIKQALITVGSGRIFGQGLGLSQQRFGLLPQSISDSIFAVFAQETGFIGSLILIFLFLIFLWRGFKIGKEASEKFSKLTSFGITSWILIQAFLNIGSMIGVLPLTGIPLPFISYGGSALVAELVGVGILLNISKNTT